MEYAEENNGSLPLLLIHGFPLDHTLWIEQLQGINAHVIAPDLRGFGESTTVSGKVTMDIYAEDLHALLDALGVKSAVIAGLSMGGYIALAFYRKYPQYFRGLILANTKASADSAEGKKERNDNAALAREKGVAALAEKLMPKMLASITVLERPETVKSVSAMMSRQSVDGVVAALLAMRDRLDSRVTLERISAPTLIITGSEDRLIAPKESELMYNMISGAKLVVLANAGHLSNIDQPDAFNREINDFLKTIVC